VARDSAVRTEGAVRARPTMYAHAHAAVKPPQAQVEPLQGAASSTATAFGGCANGKAAPPKAKQSAAGKKKAPRKKGAAAAADNEPEQHFDVFGGRL
jgi:hypothetical protein